ncbi:MAG: enolase C-terminal domain-like protein [Planctomycetota bacterium]
MRPTDIRIKAVEFTTDLKTYRTPIKFGGRVVVDALLFNVTIDVETRSGKIGRGFGSMPLANAWAWPSSVVDGEQALAAMLEFARQAAQQAAAQPLTAHPLQLTRTLAQEHHALATAIQQRLQLAEPIPVLAQLVAASPVEAAIHDAFGRALGANAYDLLGPDYISEDLGSFLGPEFAGEYLDRYTLRQPKTQMPLYHLVGALDPLSHADVKTPVGDGLPETLGEWIGYNGLTHLKIKLAGDNLPWDVARVTEVNRVSEEAQAARGCNTWCYSLDFNEKCANVQYVLDFLEQLRLQSPRALDRVQYIEQPTHRDLKRFPENRMHAAAQIKPVVIDESLIDYESLLLAREQGYSGVALKACKGHTEALLMGAAAQKYGLFLCVQDLTCVGYSFLHSASIAARLPTIAAIEGNGRQYCPAGNQGWEERFPTMFHITTGSVGTAALTGPGLGF